MTRAWCFLGVLLLMACDSGPEPDLPGAGTLEITVDAPAVPDGDPLAYLLVQARLLDVSPFEVAWEGADPPAIPLSATDRSIFRTTMSSADGSKDVALKVRFCRDPRCLAFEDEAAPSLWFAIENPFYAGETTEWQTSVELPAVPPSDTMCADACDDFDCDPAEAECDVAFVDGCQIRGCVEGDPASSYCTTDGLHFCALE